MLIELVILGITFLLIWDYTVKKHRNDLLEKANIKGPKSWPIIGSSLSLKDVKPESKLNLICLLENCN